MKKRTSGIPMSSNEKKVKKRGVSLIYLIELYFNENTNYKGLFEIRNHVEYRVLYYKKQLKQKRTQMGFELAHLKP